MKHFVLFHIILALSYIKVGKTTEKEGLELDSSLIISDSSSGNHSSP